MDVDTGVPTLFLESEEVSFNNVTITPDGDRVAFVAEDANGRPQIFVINADGTDRRQLTQGSPGAAQPSWSPDGGEVAFRGIDRDGSSDVYIAAGGSGDTWQLTHESRDVGFAVSWSPDGKTIFYQVMHPSVLRRVDIKTRTTSTLLEDAALPDVSPDGSRLAFNTWSIGHVTLANIDGSGRTVIESAFDTNSPKWSPDGERIAFRDLEGQTYLYEVSTGEMRLVGPGNIVEWLDDETLLVSVN
jgi:Tol biopolymer transport system component